MDNARNLNRGWALLDHFKFKMQFLTTANTAEIELPKLSRETKRGPMLVQVRYQFEPAGAPQISQADVGAEWFEFDRGVEGKWRAIWHEAGEGITVEMVAMRWIGGPIRI